MSTQDIIGVSLIVAAPFAGALYGWYLRRIMLGRDRKRGDR